MEAKTFEELESLFNEIDSNGDK